MDSISFLDSKEAFYHGFLLGVLGNMDDFLVKSNRESGQGRYDILVRSLDVTVPAVIFELKVSDTFKNMNETCDLALRQITEKIMMHGFRRKVTPKSFSTEFPFSKNNAG